MARYGSIEPVVSDRLQPCPYLPDQTARMPLRYPQRPLAPAALDARMASGDRRTGRFLYRTQCPACSACEPIRLDLRRFRLNQGHRRTLRRGDQQLRLEIGPPFVDAARLAVYNRHKTGRGLAADESDAQATPFDYASFLVDSCCETLEFSYWHGEQLAAVAVADRGAECLNAVYCCFDPAFDRLSPGTYSILKQVEYCQQQSLRYLYLGLYIAASPHMNYKARFRPHERRIAGEWREFA